MVTKKIKIYIDETYGGEMEAPLVQGPTKYWPHSTSYFCPKCGKIWAQLKVEGDSHYGVKWRPCLKHGSGILQDSINDHLLFHYPLNILKREFTIIAKALENLPNYKDRSSLFPLYYIGELPHE